MLLGTQMVLWLVLVWNVPRCDKCNLVYNISVRTGAALRCLPSLDSATLVILAVMVLELLISVVSSCSSFQYELALLD